MNINRSFPNLKNHANVFAHRIWVLIPPGNRVLLSGLRHEPTGYRILVFNAIFSFFTFP
jgi:hypothetical protein